MSSTELNELFAAPPTRTLPEDVLAELQSIIRIHSLSEQELFFKWEAYSIKMGVDAQSLDYNTVRNFKKDLQDTLERESRGKAHVQSASKRSHAGTPRAATGGDVFGVLHGLVSGTPSGPKSVIKRKSQFETPSSSSKLAKTPARPSPNSELKHTPGGALGAVTSFDTRPNPGERTETINGHLPCAEEQPRRKELLSSSSEVSDTMMPRVKIKAVTELGKFNYRPMAMKLTEASEVLDDRLDEFALLVQQHHQLSDAAFGNPAAQGTAEVVAIGRIASDTDARLAATSVVLETSRRMGAGMRIPLRIASDLAYDLFPGRIVAVRGTNPAGEYFNVTEMLSIPKLPPAASTVEEIEAQNQRLQTGPNDSSSPANLPLNVLIGAGPYTTDADLSYAAFDALLQKAEDTCADVLILNGFTSSLHMLD